MELTFTREFNRKVGKVILGELRGSCSTISVFIKFYPAGGSARVQASAKTEIMAILSLQSSQWIPRFRVLHHEDRGTYIGMELLPGGDLMMHLESRGKLDLPVARCILAQVVACIESVHSLRWIHRNLRPENLVFNEQGELRLVNFSLSHRFGEQTECEGDEVDYLAPEVLAHEPYSESVDVWSIGIILYEMLCGGPPFSDEKRDRNKTIFRILNPEKYLWFPTGSEEIADVAVDLIRSLLKHHTARPGIREIKKHPFFAPVEWGNLQPFILRSAQTRLSTIISG